MRPFSGPPHSSEREQGRIREKIFMQHLTMLTGSSDFQAARDRLLDSDKLIFPPNGKYQTVITNAFSQRGVGP